MRAIKRLIIHCSDSDRESHADINVIRAWHLKRGFDDVGYHFFIIPSGVIQEGRDVSVVGAHCKGHNSDSIGICLHGRDKFSVNQKIALINLVKYLMKKHNIKKSNVYPHCHFDENKTCPNFDVRTEIIDFLD